jgi:hypothetical protein
LPAPWILFEAGALSKLTSAYVCTLLFELEPSDVAPPLGQFQHSRLNKEEMRALLNTINAELPTERGLDVTRLDDAFETWWPKLEDKLKSIPEKPEAEHAPEKRGDDSKLDEILELVRTVVGVRPRATAPPVQIVPFIGAEPQFIERLLMMFHFDRDLVSGIKRSQIPDNGRTALIANGYATMGIHADENGVQDSYLLLTERGMERRRLALQRQGFEA